MYLKISFNIIYTMILKKYLLLIKYTNNKTLFSSLKQFHFAINFVYIISKN